MDNAQLRQTIQQQIERLSSDRLRLVVDFLNFLIQTEHQKPPTATETVDFRPPVGGALLSHAIPWSHEQVHHRRPN